jgi:hypothetical protein
MPEEAGNPTPFPTFGQSPDAKNKQKKPWLPVNECQFKVCHLCRPTCADRCYLSIDGVVNDEIPPTALTGFGFHLKGQRPVALVKDVKNLGLRASPPASPVSLQLCLLY